MHPPREHALVNIQVALGACIEGCDHPKHANLRMIASLMNRKRKAVFSPENSETEYSSSDQSSSSVCSNHIGVLCDCACSGVVGQHDIVIIHLSSDSDGSIDID